MNSGGLMNASQQSSAAAPSHANSSAQMQAILQKGLRSSSEPAHQPLLKKSDSTASFKEGLR